MYKSEKDWLMEQDLWQGKKGHFNQGCGQGQIWLSHDHLIIND